jgi:hypothetical protein
MNRVLVIIAACLLSGCVSEQTDTRVSREREYADEWKWQRNEKERELRDRQESAEW